MKNQKDKLEYVRKNGAVTMVLLSPSMTGLPYGTIPRLLLLYITTQAIRTKEQNIVLGESLSSFVSRLNGYTTGGAFNRIKQQSLRLFSSSFSVFINTDKELNYINRPLVDKYTLFKQSPGSDIVLHLSDYFWQDIKQNKPIPVDLRAVNALKASPLSLDLYFWLKKRLYRLAGSVNIPTEQVFNQFGTAYSYKKTAIRYLYPDLGRNYMRLLPFSMKNLCMMYRRQQFDLQRVLCPKIAL